MNLFFKKNLIFKTFLLLFLLVIFFFSANFFYNQSKGILAVEEVEEEEEGRLRCGKEIPIGEALEKTGELLEKIMEEVERIERNSSLLIESHKEMEELAKRCNLDNCIPSCEEMPILIPYRDEVLYECVPQPCKGDPCPGKEKIIDLFADITIFNEEIQKAEDKIYKLIYKKVEPICIKGNEDIRTLADRAQCAINPACWVLTQEGLLLLPRELLLGVCAITKQEAIRRKLNLSRNEFDKCYIPPADLEGVLKGEIEGKILFNCVTVMDQDLPRETKTEVEGVPVCTSLHNWFCCH